MPYRRGDLTIVPKCPLGKTRDEWEDCDEHYDHAEGMTDNRRRSTDAEPISAVVYMPHSCDRWVIGDVVAVAMLIRDLEAVLREIQPR